MKKFLYDWWPIIAGIFIGWFFGYFIGHSIAYYATIQ